MVPLENSIGGTIHRNYDLLLDHDLSISGEVELDVVHCLQALPGTKLGDVKVVYSHPQALAQCERYLKDLGVQVEAVYDTAGGAKLVAEKKLAGAAALASRRAAEVFGLEVLQEAVQDFEFNITRFAIIGGAPPDDANKTTIVFALPSTPGSLFKALSVFALRDINLTKLESRPMRGRPVGIPVLRRSRSATRRPRVRPRADAPRRVRALDARAGDVQGDGSGRRPLNRLWALGFGLWALGSGLWPKAKAKSLKPTRYNPRP